MSFDAIPRPLSRSPPKPKPTLEDSIAHLVDRPSSSSASEALSRIYQQALSFEQIVIYTESIDELWNNPSASDDLTAVRSKLLGDASKLNVLVKDQLEIAKDSQSLLSELNNAWSAAEGNAKIARDMYRKAKLLPDQREELHRVQARCAVLEKEQSIRELIAAQHKELLDQFALSAAERQELERLRARTVSDLSSKVDGIQLTTDRIAQSISNMANAEQSAGQELKRRNISGLFSSDREATFTPAAVGQRRSSLPLSILGTTGSRRTSGRLSLPSPTQPSAEFAGAAQSAAEAPEPAPEGPPFPSAAQPNQKVDDHKQPDVVFANILAWDGQDLFDKAELPSVLTDTLKNYIKDKLCGLDKAKFRVAFEAGINSVKASCVWQRAEGRRPATEYYACDACIAKKRPCLIRIRDPNRGQYCRPHLAPLPDNLRPQNATRQDPEYWVVPDPPS